MTPLTNSFLIAVCSTAIACLLGVLAGFALLAVSPSRRLAVSFLALSALPLLVPSYVIVSFWMEALGTNGWLARLVADGNAVSFAGLWPTILVLSLIYWSPVALISYFTLTKIDRAMIEAAELTLGKLRANARVVAPLLLPSVAASAALVFVLTFSNFSVPAIFQVRTIQNDIYVQFNASFNVGRAFLLAFPQLIAAMIGVVWLGGVLKRRSWIVTVVRPSGGPNAGPVSGGVASARRRWAVAFLAGLVLLSAVAPMLRAVESVLQAKTFWQTLIVSATQIWNSFLFSLLAATLVLAIAVGCACTRTRKPVGAQRRLPRSPSGIDSMVLIPFVLPEVLIGVALIALFNRPSLQFLYTSLTIVLVALTVRYFIVGKLAVSVGRSHLDPSLLEAAELAGLPFAQKLVRIQLPLLSRWLLAGWWLTYLFCLADVGSLVLIYPPGCDTVPIRIFNLLHYGYDTQVSALCLVMLALAAAPFMLWPLIRFFYDRMSPA